jgi:hypothetical protein
VDLPAGDITMRHLARLVERGQEDADLSALITVLEEGSEE